MTSGLLWYDASASTLAQKVETAAKRYKEKYGVMPNLCFVNPVDREQDTARGETILVSREGIVVRNKETIMPNHLWLGRDK